VDAPKVPKKRGRKPKPKPEVSLDTTTPVAVKVPKKRGRKPKPKTAESLIPKVPKKRGRKPKPKTAESLLPKVHKKRGRKPKPKTAESLLPKVPKKRGRKPKQKCFGLLPNGQMPKAEIDEDKDNIIIHLPIHTKDIVNEFIDEKILTYNPTINIPAENEASEIGGTSVDNLSWVSSHSSYKNNNNKLLDKGPPPSSNLAPYPFNTQLLDQPITKPPTSEPVNEVDEADEPIEFNKKVTNYQQIRVTHTDNWYEENTTDITVQNLIRDVVETKSLNYNSNKKKSKKVEEVMKEFNETACHLKWPQSTSIYCFWCCHSFNNIPCALPLRYVDDTYNLYGCFCCPECAAAYNFKNMGNNNESWERYSLLNNLYKDTFSDANIKIKLAPSRETLNIFGGNLTINEFRNMCTNYKKTHKIIMPPFISCTPQQEEVNIHNKYYKTKNFFIPVNKDDLEKANENLRLCRRKPLTKKSNTLENCMNLKYI